VFPGSIAKVTKTKQIEGFNVAAKWKKKFKGCAPNEGWFILTNFGDLLLSKPIETL